MSYLDNLNAEQRKAVLEKDGPILIVAGAGAGKTKTITNKIFHLVKEGIEPSSILAITFTNKAAKEMRDRIHTLLAADKSLNLPMPDFSSATRYTLQASPFINTFHALGVHILRENGKFLDIPRHFSIMDKSDSLKLIKDAMDRVGVDRKSFDPANIQNLISREKGNAVILAEFQEKNQSEYVSGLVASVWKEYEIALRKEKALDFDDLLLKTLTLLRGNKEVLLHYQNIWRYIHIDEYQDTNKVQYLLAKLLAEKYQNICVVGDMDQCLLPNTKIKTADGDKKIMDIRKGETITGASGNGSTCFAKVSGVIKNKYDGEILEIETGNEAKIRITPGHMLFARLSLTENLFYVYLMYRRDKGFRIGIAKSVRRDSYGNRAVGLLVRCNQEKADKMWILKICKTRREASYWEIYFSSQYGIPTLVFLTCGRKLTIEQEDIDKIFREIDTKTRVSRLFKETGFDFHHPHYFPQGTTRSNSKRDRLNINLNMFSDRRKSIVRPWGMSRVSISTTDADFRRTLEGAGFKTRKGKKGDWRLEIARLDYGEAERIAQKIHGLKPNLTLVRSAFITQNKKMLFQPASNIIPGMLIGRLKGYKIVEEKVISVRKKRYRGIVYDLNIDHIHNYIANNIVVHNCIYSWRGADVKNILGFEKDYPKTKIIFLEENYRSTQTILTAANRVIAKNKLRKDKKLFTRNSAGENIGFYEAYDENDEARFVALKAKSLIEEYYVSPREIAVLYRANFQSRALEEAMISENIPYQVLGTRFFERKEIKDIVAYLKASLNEESFSDLKRIINVPKRGLGKVTILKLFAGREHELPFATKKKISDFKKLLQEIKRVAFLEKPSQTIKYIIRYSGIEAELKENGGEEERLENIRELVTFATKYDRYEKPDEGILHFLEDVALATDQDELSRDKLAVKLMTVHASKGLEFEYVFITGLEEDLFPHKRENGGKIDEHKSEEERRLFYVALTRAKKKLYLSHASIRTIFGSRQVNTPSEFIGDLGDDLLEKEQGVGLGGKIIYLD